MTMARNEYKKVQIKGQCFLYPVPVAKESKYLIKVNETFSDFFLYAYGESFLKSADFKGDYLKQSGLHDDGNTIIYEIVPPKLKLNLLANSELDPKKSEVVEKLLTKKIAACLQEVEGARNDLEKSFERQKKCKTCIILGILSPKLEKLISLISNH
jgi:hypothetical protein